MSHATKDAHSPGYDRPPSWGDAHHIIHCADGGDTALRNLVLLLCSHHHERMHGDHWTIKMIDERPGFVPSTWLDPNNDPDKTAATAYANSTPSP